MENRSKEGEKKMKLNLMERISVLQILPKEGNFITLKVIGELQQTLAPSEAEFKEFEIVQEGENIRWNAKGNIEKELPVGDKACEVIVNVLKKLDNEEKLTNQHFSVYKKFILEDK